MARYPQGQGVRLNWTVKDATGILVDASSTLITLFNTTSGASTTYTTPVRDSLGTYHFDLPSADVAAATHYQWISDANVAGTHGLTYGAFDVFDPLEVTVLSLQDAKQQLNITPTDVSQDDELATMLASVTTLMERVTGGPIVTRSITERCEGTHYATQIAVRQRPLVSVTSITSVTSGTAIPTTDLELDSNSGIIRRKLGLPFLGGIYSGGFYYTVVYKAGWGTTVHPDFNTAGRLILQSLWRSQRAPAVNPFAQGTADTGLSAPVPGEIPPAALQVLRPYMLEVAV